MKSVAVLAIVAGVSAQVPAYNSIGDAINAQVTSLDALVKAYTGGPGTAVVAQASRVLSVVNSGASAIPGLSSFTDLGDALLLLNTYTPLAANIQTVVSDLVAQKSLIDEESGLCQTASSLLVAESSAAVRLANAVVAQLQDPSVGGAPEIASGSVINPITSALASGVAAYASCPSASAAPTSTTPAKTTTPGTSAPTSAPTSDSTPTATASASTCTSSGYNTKQIKKCLKIISSAALGQGAGYGEL